MVLWCGIVVSTAIKVWLAFAVDSTPAVLDEGQYLRLARGIAEQGRFEGTFRPPLYPAFLATHLRLGWGTLGVRLTQALLSAATVVVVFLIARRALSSRGAVGAALIVAFDPVLGMFAHRLWSETLFILLATSAWGLLVTDPNPRRPVTVNTLAGVLIGLACLTRPMLLTLVPLLLPWLWWSNRGKRVFMGESAAHDGQGAERRELDPSRRRPTPESEKRLGALSQFALIATACVVTIAPWTIRNAIVARAFIPIDSNGPFNFLVGTQSEAAFIDKDDRWDRRYGIVSSGPYESAVQHDAAGAQSDAMRLALKNIRRDPTAYFKKCVWEAAHLWTLDSFLLRHLRNDWYRPVTPTAWIPALTVLSAGFWAVMVLAAIVGWAFAPPTSIRSLISLLAVHSTLLFGLTYSLSRYAVPLRPMLAILAVAAIMNVRWTRNMTGRTRRAVWVRGVIAAIFATSLIAAWTGDIALLRDMIVSGGVNHRFRMY